MQYSSSLSVRALRHLPPPTVIGIAVGLTCLSVAALSFIQSRRQSGELLEKEARLLGVCVADQLECAPDKADSRLPAEVANGRLIAAVGLFGLDQSLLTYHGVLPDTRFPGHLLGHPMPFQLTGRLEVLQPVMSSGQHVGYVYLRSDAGAVSAEALLLATTAGLLALFAWGAGLAGAALASRMMKNSLPQRHRSSRGVRQMAGDRRPANCLRSNPSKPAVAPTEAPLEQSATNSATNVVGPNRILVISASETLRDLTQMVLRRSGARVHGARDLLDAVRQASSVQFDLVVWDLPRIEASGGPVECGRLNQLANLPLVALSDEGRELDEARWNTTFVAHLPKRVAAETLHKAVRGALTADDSGSKAAAETDASAAEATVSQDADSAAAVSEDKVRNADITLPQQGPRAPHMAGLTLPGRMLRPATRIRRSARGIAG